MEMEPKTENLEINYDDTHKYWEDDHINYLLN